MPIAVDNSLFSGLKPGAPIEVVEVCKRFVDDPSAVKENLSVGGYMNDEGRIHLMKVVKKAEEDIQNDPSELINYFKLKKN